MKSLVLLIGVVLLSGCSSLILRDHDSALQTTGKVTARVLLCPITFCFSELAIAESHHRDMEQAYVDSLSREEYQHYRDQKMRSAAMFLGSGGFRTTPIQPYVPQPIPYAPVYQAPPVRPPVNCTSNRVGDYTYTNCN